MTGPFRKTSHSSAYASGAHLVEAGIEGLREAGSEFRRRATGKSLRDKVIIGGEILLSPVLPQRVAPATATDQTDIPITDYLPERAEFAPLKEVYDREIRPMLQDIEAQRHQAQSDLKRAIPIGVAAFLIGWVTSNILVRILSYEAGSGYGQLAFYGGFAGAAWIIYPSLRKRAKIIDTAREQIMQTLLGALDCVYTRTPELAPGYRAFERFGVFDNHHTAHFEDYVEGRWAGVQFAFCEVELIGGSRTQKKHQVTVFRGPVFELNFPKRLFGKTLIIPRRAKSLKDRIFGSSARKQLEPVRLPDEFEALYSAHSNDQVEARYLLDPRYMETLISLQDRMAGRNLRVLTDGQRMFVAFDAADKFELDRHAETLAHPARIGQFVQELDELFHLIEVFTKQNTD